MLSHIRLYWKYSLFILILLLLIAQKSDANIKIFVISDIHYFDPDLLISDGPAFQSWVSTDRKLLKESESILESLIRTILQEDPDIVLVTGDLTKDGERSGHEKVAQYFLELEQHGIKVYVTPGNHDILNPYASSFNFDEMIPVETINKNEFSAIYNEFGYSEAFDKDTASLSYIAEPQEDLWILSMDACKYDSNQYYNTSVTSGAFKESTKTWIMDKLEKAENQNKKVIGIMHHNLVEHFYGQEVILWQYVVSQWDEISSLFADAGLKIVFTGHTHAQDIVKYTSASGNTIFDVETGSAITYPCPYRIVNMHDNGILEIKSGKITEIDYDTKFQPFQNYAYDNLLEGIQTMVPTILEAPPYNLSPIIVNIIEPALTESVIAHYEGNEGSPSKTTMNIIDIMKLQDPEMATILEEIWKDPEPDDWDININLNDIATATAIPSVKEMYLYPNPAYEKIHICLSDHINENVKMNIYSSDGILIYSTTITDSFSVIPVSSLSSGIYYISIPELKITARLIIEK